MTGDGSKIQCCKEQYCVGTWNVRSMNQGKLEGAAHLGHRRAGVWEAPCLLHLGSGCAPLSSLNVEKQPSRLHMGTALVLPLDTGRSSPSSVPAHSLLEWTPRAQCNPIPGGFLTSGVHSPLPTALRFPNSMILSPDY